MKVDFARNSEILESLTEKQLQVLLLLANGMTSKEIAFELSISESAAIQRVETLRRKFGSVPRSEVARIGRLHFGSDTEFHTCNSLTGNKNQLPPIADRGHDIQRSQSEPGLKLADSYPLDRSAPWSVSRDDRLVPEVLDGENAAPARWLFVVAAAVLMAILLLVLLAVANAIGELA